MPYFKNYKHPEFFTTPSVYKYTPDALTDEQRADIEKQYQDAYNILQQQKRESEQLSLDLDFDEVTQ